MPQCHFLIKQLPWLMFVPRQGSEGNPKGVFCNRSHTLHAYTGKNRIWNPTLTQLSRQLIKQELSSTVGQNTVLPSQLTPEKQDIHTWVTLGRAEEWLCKKPVVPKEKKAIPAWTGTRDLFPELLLGQNSFLFFRLQLAEWDTALSQWAFAPNCFVWKAESRMGGQN